MLLKNCSSFSSFGWPLLSLLIVGCGSRTELRSGEGDRSILPAGSSPGIPMDSIECEIDSHCDQSNLCATFICEIGRCVPQPEVVCTSTDSCSDSACDPSSGLCVETAKTVDLDGDGYRAPLPGFEPGEAGACGFDCDDTNRRAFPGGQEACDGADNDCDGVIDNGQDYLAPFGDRLPEQRPVDGGEFTSSIARSIAYGDGVYGIGYYSDPPKKGYIGGFSGDGESVFPPTSVNNTNATSFGPALTWSGNAFGAAWSDNRFDDNYEVFFSRFDIEGNKLAPDLRLTYADYFSSKVQLIFDQGRFAVAWNDWRDQDITGGAQVYAQLLDEQGELLGENILLNDSSEIGERPAISATDRRFGVVYMHMTVDQRIELRFRSFDKNLGNPTDATVVASEFANSPHISAVGDRFVVSWSIENNGPGESIMGVVLDEMGRIEVGPMPITSPGGRARTPETISLGDRFVLLWADELAGNLDIYAKVMDLNFAEVEPRVQLSTSEEDEMAPRGVLGDSGRITVTFNSYTSYRGSFTSVGCETPLIVP